MAALTGTTLKHAARTSAAVATALLTTVVGATAGAALAFVVLIAWNVASQSELPLLWWASRATGFLAYVALWLSMASGVLISAGGFGGRISRKWTMDLHQEWTLAAVIATVLHIALVVLNPEAEISPWAAIIPFASARMTGSMAVGTISTLLLTLIAVTSWVRTRIPYEAWRGIHALSFGAMLLALAHSIAAGTDTSSLGAQVLYLATSVSLTGLIALRILATLAARTRDEVAAARP
ncbi:MAG: ferric reductase-like transmembrane domain-containing protein [Dehalococcoidia bacterium]